MYSDYYTYTLYTKGYTSTKSQGSNAYISSAAAQTYIQWKSPPFFDHQAYIEAKRGYHVGQAYPCGYRVGRQSESASFHIRVDAFHVGVDVWSERTYRIELTYAVQTQEMVRFTTGFKEDKLTISRQECKRSCPVVKMGKLCIEVNPTDKKAFLSEELCIGCGICVKK